METWLKEILERKNNAVVIENSSEPVAAKGESYASDTHRILVIFSSSDGSVFETSYILKELPKSEVSRKILEDYGCFEAEINVYLNILPAMEHHFKSDKASKPWCDYIGHHLKEALVLEDLKASRFRGCPRKQGLDLAHALVALQGLGIYHGLSKKLSKEDHPLTLMNLVQNRPEPQSFLKGAFQVCSEAVSSWGPKWLEVGEKLMKEKDMAFRKLQSLAEKSEERFVVLNHGDCWTCNMMFSYNHDNIPYRVKFFDFQTPHWNSFGWDIHGILACSVQPEIRRNNWHTLVRTYADTLANTMIKCGIDEKLIPTLDQILEELERLKYHRFVCMVGMYPICCGESGGYDPEKNVEGSDNPSVSAVLYGERYKNDVQDDLWNFYTDGTF